MGEVGCALALLSMAGRRCLPSDRTQLEQLLLLVLVQPLVQMGARTAMCLVDR